MPTTYLRTILCLSAVFALLAAASLVERSPARQPKSNTAEVRWVRTRDGWEKDGWSNRAPLYEPSLHPAVVTLGLCLASAAALVAESVLRAARPQHNPLAPPHGRSGTQHVGRRHDITTS